MRRMKFGYFSGSFMAFSIIGLLGSLIFFDDLGLNWGITFFIFFIMCFISSVITMTYGPVEGTTNRKRK